MKFLKLAVLLVFAVSLSACAGPQLMTKQEAFPKMYDQKPVSLLVLPPMNQTTAADAKEFYQTTIAEPLSLKGYYVFPVEVVSDIMRFDGFDSTEELLAVPPQKFKEYFGADAVMFIIIDKWDTNYYVVGGNVEVSISYILKSTESGETLWQYKDSLKVDTSGQNQGGGWAGLVIALAETAIKTKMQDYVPIAQRINNMALTSIPYGQYHTGHGTDMEQKTVLAQKASPKAE